jgi:hypothetical protein
MRVIQIMSGVTIAVAVALFVYFNVLYEDEYRSKGYEFFIQIGALCVFLGIPGLLMFLVATWRLRRQDDEAGVSIFRR